MGLPPDADGELPQKEEAARAPQVRCARAQCITGAAVILTASPVAEGAADSTIDARLGRALYTVALCERAAQDPTSEACGASGLRRSSSPYATLLTVWPGWIVPLHWRLHVARFRLVVTALVSSSVARRVEGCREAHVPSCPALHGVFRSSNNECM